MRSVATGNLRMLRTAGDDMYLVGIIDWADQQGWKLRQDWQLGSCSMTTTKKSSRNQPFLTARRCPMSMYINATIKPKPTAYIRQRTAANSSQTRSEPSRRLCHAVPDWNRRSDRRTNPRRHRLPRQRSRRVWLFRRCRVNHCGPKGSVVWQRCGVFDISCSNAGKVSFVRSLTRRIRLEMCGFAAWMVHPSHASGNAITQ